MSVNNGNTMGPVVSLPRHGFETLGEIVGQLIRNSERSRNHHDRRAKPRHPYPHLIRITPTSRDGEPCSQSLHVVGKHISQDGIGFFHHESLPYRYIVAEFGMPNDQAVEVLVNLVWCRFIYDGWYDSGGRFVRLMDSPIS